jgi:hypothetical protein
MKPLFITGVPRSGTTYMMTLLNRHSKIFLTDETRVMVWATDVLHRKEVWEDTQVLNTDKEAFRHLLVNHLRFLIRDYYHKFMGAASYAYWGDKMPHQPGARYFLAILELYPNAKIINVHRDPRSVVASLLTKGWAKEVAGGVELWCKLTWAAIKYEEIFGPEQFLSIHYRDMLRSRRKVALDCLKFLDLQMEVGLEKWLQAEKKEPTIVSAPTAAIGTLPQDRLAPAHEEYVLSQCEELMEKLGYVP